MTRWCSSKVQSNPNWLYQIEMCSKCPGEMNSAEPDQTAPTCQLHNTVEETYLTLFYVVGNQVNLLSSLSSLSSLADTLFPSTTYHRHRCPFKRLHYDDYRILVLNKYTEVIYIITDDSYIPCILQNIIKLKAQQRKKGATLTCDTVELLIEKTIKI